MQSESVKAEELARQMWGYFKGDSTGGATAMQWFDNNKSLGGPAHVIELCLRALSGPIDDGSCAKCGSAPRNNAGLCATCVDEAALSTNAEPDGWICEDEFTLEPDKAWEWEDKGLSPKPFYFSPQQNAEPVKTAPAVAVKALEPEDPAVYRHWEKDELIAALIAERTLSAQVQDVAGNAELLRMVDIAENRLIAIHKALHPEMHGITGIESPQDHVAYMVSVLQAAYDGVAASPRLQAWRCRMSDIIERLEATKHGLYWDVARDSIAEITRLRTALSEAEQRARREALEEADAIVAKALSQGSDIPPKTVKHIVGIRSAIRALIPSEPHDAEGRN